MSTTIDSLQIEIQSNSTSAAKGIDDLAVSLGKLKDNGKFTTAVKNLNNLSDSLKRMTTVSSNANKLSSLADSVNKLSGAGSISKVVTQLGKLPSAMKELSKLNIDDGLSAKLSRIADTLSPLSNIKSGGLSTMVNSLAKLDKVSDSLNDATIARFAERVKKLNDALGPLSQKMTTIQTGLRGVNSSAKKAASGVGEFDKKVSANKVNLASAVTIIQGFVNALMPVVRFLADVIGQAIEWDGIAQRFGRGFGDQASEVYAWVQRLNEEMGINVQQFMQYSSVYATMLTGFGVATKDASKMALGYTELTYDIWAGYNDIYKSYADAADAVKSAIAGEVEPIRKAGFTIVESQLEQTAANHGLTISLENATEAQKSYLRYLTLVDQAHSQNLVGTYARELNTAEGLMRTFSQQLKSLAQAFGSLFLPILVKVMPWLQAFVELLTIAIHRVAEFFGIEIQKVDWGSGLGGVADSATDASGALDDTTGSINDTTDALKDLKKATIGIDELNVISPPTANKGGAGGSGMGSDLSAFEGLDVGSLWDESIFDQVQFEVDNIIGKLKEALSTITAVVSGFALAIGTILVLTGANIPLGLGLMAIGAVGLVATIAENWNTMSDQLAKTLTVVTSVIGGFMLAIGALFAFTGVNVPLGVAFMVAGAVSLATAATINWKFLEGDMKNTLSILTGIISGGLLAMGALFAFTGVSVGLGIALMAAGAVGLATAVGLNWDFLSEPMKKAIGTLEAVVGSALLAVGAILTFTGVNLPLGIGLMAAGAVSLVSAVTLNWNSLTGTMKNKIATLTALVSGALIGVGAILAFTGVALPLGIAMIAAGAVGIVASASLNWSWLTEKIKSVLKEIGIAVGAALLALGVILCLSGVGIPLGIGLIALGASSLVAGVALNWDSIRSKVESVVNKIVEWLKKYGLLALGVILCLTGVGIPLGIALINRSLSGESTAKTDENGLLNKIKTKWSEIKTWWSKKGELKPIDAAVSLVKKGWTTVKGWIGSIPGVSQAVGLAKKGWSTVKGWIGSIPKVNQTVGLLKSGWSTVSKWVGTMPTLKAKIGLIKSGWTSIKKWLGDLDFNLKFKLPKIGVNWGSKTVLGFKISYPTSFYTYAKGGFPDLGEMFIARENGPEMVGRIGNRSTVANNDQIVEGISEGVYAAVLAAMRASESDGGQSVNVYLDGKQITSAVEKHQRERGASLMGKEVYSY